MGTTLKRQAGVQEGNVRLTSGLRSRSYYAHYGSAQTAIVNSVTVGAPAGAPITTYTTVALAGQRVNWPSTLVALLSTLAPGEGTFQLRVKGFDQFGNEQVEETPEMTFEATTNNYYYLAKVFSFVTEVAYKSNGVDDGAPFSLSLGQRFDWVRTVDANNNHHYGENLGLGLPLLLRHRPQGGVGGNLQQSHDLFPDAVAASGTLTVTTTAATGTLTVGAGIANAETVTIGGIVYTFQDTLTTLVGGVKRSGVIATDLATLAKAINGTGVAGVDYTMGTAAHPTVSATSGATTLVATARTPGTAGNAITTTETGANMAWGAATLAGGTGIVNNETVTIDGKAYTFKTTITANDGDVAIGGSDATALINLAKAINLSGVAGTDYGANTTVHATARALRTTATTLVLEAKAKGALGNLIATTETGVSLAWSAAALTGGVSGSGEIQGVSVYDITGSGGALPLMTLGGTQIEIGRTATGWSGALEKWAPVNAAAVAQWAVADNVTVALQMHSLDEAA